MKYKNVKIHPKGGFECDFRFTKNGQFYKMSASTEMFLIRMAWENGCSSIERICDGHGAGAGSQGDWSAIRDSSASAKDRMFEAALNHFFGD